MIATHDEPQEQPQHQGAAPILPHGPAREELDLAVRRLDEAERERDPAAMSEALAGIARCYRTFAAFATAMDFMHQALRWSYALGGVDQRVELLCELAEMSCEASDAARAKDNERQTRSTRELARDMSFEAARLSAQAADPYWEIKVLLRASDVLDRCGDHDDAIMLQTRAMTLMVSHPDVCDAIADGQETRPGCLM